VCGEAKDEADAVRTIGRLRPDVVVVDLSLQNGSGLKQTFRVYPRAAQGALSSWEWGYESLPDPAWLTVDRPEVSVEAHAAAPVTVTLNIPDRPEHYNRKWVALKSPDRIVTEYDFLGALPQARPWYPIIRTARGRAIQRHAPQCQEMLAVLPLERDPGDDARVKDDHAKLGQRDVQVQRS
jgi:hypothetical protein